MKEYEHFKVDPPSQRLRTGKKKTAEYNHLKIEQKWQNEWEKKKVFQAQNPSTSSGRAKPKFYGLIEFPYPSGAGMHVGHIRSNTAMDIISRKRRMEGWNVLYPIGWDAFGLPTENYALKTGIHPIKVTKQNTDTFRRQLKALGFSFDWSREVNTTDPKYYRWTQWIFLQFFKKGLAYKAKTEINWCPKDKIGLANEEVVGGLCERCGSPIEKREKEQWMLAITKYAERLHKDLDTVDYLPKIKIQQRNWIGKKTGINITYDISENGQYDYVLLHGFNGSPDGVFFPWLKKKLSERGLNFQAPQLPNPKAPTEDEQVNYVLNNCKFDQNTILFGHSLGAVVAMKVLEKLDKKIAGLVLAGGFVDHVFKDKQRPFDKTFNWKFDFNKIKKCVGFVKILSDPTDYAIPIEQGRILSQKLGGVLVETAGKQPHFTDTEEPIIFSALFPQITCFTTRPDTNFGATFVVVGPEHMFLKDRNVLNIDPARWAEIEKYKKMAASTPEELRTAENKEKTGVFTGFHCTNQLTDYRMPLYVADYVLGNVGTGAVVGVPGHDKRDFEFAKKFGLEVKRVVQKNAADVGLIDSIEKVQEDEGVMVNSGFLDGIDIHAATQKIMNHMEEKGYGKRVVNYKLRDWVFSRQRYWGEPIPLINCEKCGWVPVPDKDLPVELPKVKNYQPTDTGESPLANISKWVNTTCPKCKSKAKRETDTMPNWAGSSWYYLAYIMRGISNFQFPISKYKKAFKHWLPVDWYNGGMEHTTLHLLYSRFWHKFLYDLGLVPTSEPYMKRTSHGMILAAQGEKMSKSKGNVVNPDDMVKTYGADTLRTYEMFMGPFDQAVYWNTDSMVGPRRFLERVWKLADKVLKQKNPKDLTISIKIPFLDKTIKKVTEDIEAMRFNTAISTLMICVNHMDSAITRNISIKKEDYKKFLQILSPFAPHIAEEIWSMLGEKKSINLSKWPKWDEKFIADEEVKIAVQVNGRVRAEIMVPAGEGEERVKELALASEAVAKYTAGQSIKKVIYIKGRLINIVV